MRLAFAHRYKLHSKIMIWHCTVFGTSWRRPLRDKGGFSGHRCAVPCEMKGAFRDVEGAVTCDFYQSRLLPKRIHAHISVGAGASTARELSACMECSSFEATHAPPFPLSNVYQITQTAVLAAARVAWLRMLRRVLKNRQPRNAAYEAGHPAP